MKSLVCCSNVKKKNELLEKVHFLVKRQVNTETRIDFPSIAENAEMNHQKNHDAKMWNWQNGKLNYIM